MSFETDEDLLREVMERQMNYPDTDIQEETFQQNPNFQTFEEMVQSDAYIKKEIRKMLADHGITKVNSLFHKVLQEDFEALRKIIAAVPVVIKEEKVKEVKIKKEKVKEFIPESSQTAIGFSSQAKKTPVVPEVVVAKLIEKEKPKKIQKKVEEKKIQKKVEENKMEDDFIDGLIAQPQRITNNTQVFVTKLKEGEDVDTVPANLTAKELREWQHAQETTKYDELLHKGIDPHTLLTVENLKKWVEEEKKSYSYIARRLVGLPEAQVSAEAKKHNIVSEIAKRRLAIIAARKGK
jgi:hypothetical protein